MHSEALQHAGKHPAPPSVQEHYWRTYTTWVLAQPGSELEQNLRLVLALYSALWPETFPKEVPHEKVVETTTPAQ